ncbi:hypothetical protein Nepgr_010567 [Nepenthes gracilis]|uniref:DEAD-box ATP-dependent RNA helicase 50 n=1 Tax=Nepenthes gracilis TaxID=150966 RepID=A0AAD3XL71_NEPGR|nr:hypothetical protein Nepgr_010567 [Nepenthes gracilis]
MLTSSKAPVDIHGFMKFCSGNGKFPRPAGGATLSLWRTDWLVSRRVKVVRAAAYKRRPMETAGAYELVDEESGERVIVWGGADDDGFPIPPKHVLSWNPKNDKKASNTREGNGGIKVSSVQTGDMPIASTQGFACGFGRLKAQKIRNLARKASKEKQEINENKYVEQHIEGTDDDGVQYVSSDSEDDFFTVKEPITVNHDVKQLYMHQITSTKSTESSDKLAGVASSFSAAPLRGWGIGQPQHGSRRDLRDVKHHWKQSADCGFYSQKSFRELGCSDDMIESLRGQHFVRSSHIQAMAFAPVIEGKSCIIADQSGSGKTLAYLVPVIQRLREEELQGLSKSSPGNPRAVVLVPTSELASQVLRNCRSMSRSGIPFRSMVATGGFRQRTQLESLEQDMDVLIATPGRFKYLIGEGFLQLRNLRCAVLDEVDILFSDVDFELALQTLITSSPVTTQYLFVTATLPIDIYNKLAEVFPDSEVIMGPGMHRTSSGLEEFLVDCSGDDGTEKTPETAFLNKKSALLKLVEENAVSKTIVFCNKIETCRKVENALKRFDRKESAIRVLAFHAALSQETRLANMKEFLYPQSREDSVFLICTDRASRGIDFGGVDHVVLFDFPREPSEYVRRVGRTARAGGRGKAFVFVVGKQVSLARRIMVRNQKGHPLHELPPVFEVTKSEQAWVGG